jgi:predicted double-glycine peptidase
MSARMLVLAALLGGFAAGAADLRLDVPFVAQEKNGCGAASLAMVLGYWGKAEVDVAAIHQQLYDAGARGVYASAMDRYMRASGFSSYAFRGEWSDLQQHLGKGRPLIVGLKPGRGDLHYVVATGLEGDAVLLHDAADRRFVKRSRAEFEKQWRGTGNWTLLALPASR